LFDMDDLKGALGCYEEILAGDPKDMDALFEKGNVLFGLKRFEDAIDIYQNVLDMDPSFEDAKKNIEICKKAMKKRRKDGG